jgi:hypothetical protein
MWHMRRPRLAGEAFARYMEWRANRINDPVEKLRFLRDAANHSSRAVAFPAHRWRVAALVFMAIWMSAPGRNRPVLHAGASQPVEPRASALHDGDIPRVWLVESSGGAELYSNGLRIETALAAPNRPRTSFPVFARAGGDAPVAWRSVPAGIVFHSTESHQAPFEPSETGHLKRLARGVVEYVRREHAYHYVIDRFGRVFRIVPESDIANHAGYSVWADESGVYVNLNRSFLSVSLEAQTESPEMLSPAQIHAARVLTDMLRSKYGIRAANCVTHAQVSVSPASMRIGYHTDWAAGFPFGDLGLPDNYALRLPSVSEFGFEYDDLLVEASRGQPWPGLLESEGELKRRAAVENVSCGRLRARLRQRYQRILNSAAVRAYEVDPS